MEEMKYLHIILRFFIGYFVVLGVIFGTQWTYYTYLDTTQIPTLTEPIPILNPNHEVAINSPIIMRLEVFKPNKLKAEVSTNIVCDSGNS